MRFFVLASVIFLCISCSDSELETINMRVNHYQQPATGAFDQFVYLVQEGDKIGTAEWDYLYSGIVGFDYEPGYIYSIIVEKRTIDHPPEDGSSIQYTLEEVISEEKVADNVSFPVRLKNKGIPSSYVTGDAETGFKILNSIAIRCNEFCDELSQKLQSDTGVTAIFQRDSLDIYTLIDFQNQD